MAAFAKFILCAIIFVATFYFSAWMVFGLILPESVWWLGQLCALATAIFISRYIWRKLEASDNGIFVTAGCWAGVIGGISFCAGFFGPMIFAPGANQGPLLGLFITGPAGFAGGFILGLIYAIWKRKRNLG